MGADPKHAVTVGRVHFMVIQIAACGCWAAGEHSQRTQLPTASIRSNVLAAHESLESCSEPFLAASAWSLDLLFRRQRSRSECTLRSHSVFAAFRSTVEVHPLRTSTHATPMRKTFFVINRCYRSGVHASSGVLVIGLQRHSKPLLWQEHHLTEAAQRPVSATAVWPSTHAGSRDLMEHFAFPPRTSGEPNPTVTIRRVHFMPIQIAACGCWAAL
jgi:hypothetical protein